MCGCATLPTPSRSPLARPGSDSSAAARTARVARALRTKRRRRRPQLRPRRRTSGCRSRSASESCAAGFRCASPAMTSARVNRFGSGHNIRSPAPSRSPLLCRSRSRTCISRVTHGSLHAELRQVTRDRIVPAQLARIDETREHAGRHRLAVGCDLEQRAAVDALAGAGDRLAGRACVDDLAVAHDAEREARQAVARSRRPRTQRRWISPSTTAWVARAATRGMSGTSGDAERQRG